MVTASVSGVMRPARMAAFGVSKQSIMDLVCGPMSAVERSVGTRESNSRTITGSVEG